jgi:hypothetical protein
MSNTPTTSTTKGVQTPFPSTTKEARASFLGTAKDARASFPRQLLRNTVSAALMVAFILLAAFLVVQVLP